MSNYSSQMIEKMKPKWLPLATASILGQAIENQYSVQAGPRQLYCAADPTQSNGLFDLDQ
jgi:hypothetical protein